METENCLPKNCENKIHPKNGPSGNDIKDFKITNIRKNEEVPKHIKNEDTIEELTSQFKDVSTAIDGADNKVVGKSANGYWMGTNYCENGFDKDNLKTSNSSDYENRLAAAAVQVFSESQPHESIRDLGQDEDETSSTSTTTISTASPESKSDFESESCASDPVGDNVLKKLTKSSEKEENKQVVNSLGPFECTYVSCGNSNRSLPLTVHNLNQLPTTNALKLESCASATPSVTNVSSMHLVSGPMSHQMCAYDERKCKSGGECRDLLQKNLSSEFLSKDSDGEIRYEVYTSELQMGVIMKLIQKDLSEPYSIYTYRYFIHNWPKLCFLAMIDSQCVGAIVCKLDLHKKVIRRGYIAMLAVDEKYRKRKIGSNLVLQAIQAMIADDADEVVLETEISNKPALRLYENLGFVRDKRLFRYYLNGVDALRLKLWLH